jgi:hypothetical protein
MSETPRHLAGWERLTYEGRAFLSRAFEDARPEQQHQPSAKDGRPDCSQDGSSQMFVQFEPARRVAARARPSEASRVGPNPTLSAIFNFFINNNLQVYKF